MCVPRLPDYISGNGASTSGNSRFAKNLRALQPIENKKLAQCSLYLVISFVICMTWVISAHSTVKASMIMQTHQKLWFCKWDACERPLWLFLAFLSRWGIILMFGISSLSGCRNVSRISFIEQHAKGFFKRLCECFTDALNANWTCGHWRSVLFETAKI